jgi:hypothetical protein
MLLHKRSWRKIRISWCQIIKIALKVQKIVVTPSWSIEKYLLRKFPSWRITKDFEGLILILRANLSERREREPAWALLKENRNKRYADPRPPNLTQLHCYFPGTNLWQSYPLTVKTLWLSAQLWMALWDLLAAYRARLTLRDHHNRNSKVSARQEHLKDNLPPLLIRAPQNEL